MRAVRIYKTYGEQAVEIVQANPYRLAQDIRGIGFKTGDQLAQRLGIDAYSLIRAQAGVHHGLLELSGEGHCAFPEAELIQEAVKLLEIPEGIIQQAIAQELTEVNLAWEATGQGIWLYMNALYQAEMFLARTLKHLAQGAHPLPTIDTNKAVEWVEGPIGS